MSKQDTRPARRDSQSAITANTQNNIQIGPMLPSAVEMERFEAISPGTTAWFKSYMDTEQKARGDFMREQQRAVARHQLLQFAAVVIVALVVGACVLLSDASKDAKGWALGGLGVISAVLVAIAKIKSAIK